METISPFAPRRNRCYHAGHKSRRDSLHSLTARETGTVYHGCLGGVPDFDTKTKPLSTVADMNDLLNLNGAQPLDDAVIRQIRKDLPQTLKELEARIERGR